MPERGVAALAEPPSVRTQASPVGLVLEPVRLPQQVRVGVPSPDALDPVQDSLEAATARFEGEAGEEYGGGVDSHDASPGGPGEARQVAPYQGGQTRRGAVNAAAAGRAAAVAIASSAARRDDGGNAHEVEQHEEKPRRSGAHVERDPDGRRRGVASVRHHGRAAAARHHRRGGHQRGRRRVKRCPRRRWRHGRHALDDARGRGRARRRGWHRRVRCSRVDRV
mmetsp:Transcript_34871/g.74350  ORF Transcript_34871/g.74350 Transcript_34871/m.74350 type:complete len:223 (-) Transcript_34871:450-1118(-)